MLCSMRKTLFGTEEYYHLFNRGVDKRIIFNTPKDYDRFLCTLYLSNSKESFKMDNITRYKHVKSEIFSSSRGEQLVSIHAYSLMPNHFHLLVSEKVEGGISLFMQKVSTAYTMYFNKRYDRSGALFQGTFKSVHIDTDTQFRYLFSYIHANAFSVMQKNGSIRIQDIEKVRTYDYSSMKEYTGDQRIESSLLEVIPFIKDDLLSKGSVKKHLQTWLDFHLTE